MGGSQSRESVKKTIETEIQTEIVNETTNINNILAQTITTTTMNVTNNVANSITQAVGGTNLITARGITADGANSVVDLDQSITMKTIQDAVMKIKQDSGAQSELANKLTQDIIAKTKNDSAMSASLQAASNLTSLSKDAGGIEKLVSDTMNMMSGMANAATGGKISKDQETTIRNKMKASIKNVSINENNIKNIIENIVNTNITQNTTSTCQSNINPNNTIDAQDGAIAAKNGGKITIRQSAAVDSLAKCIVDTANTTQISTAIISEGATGAVNDTQNTNKADTKGTADAKVSDTNIQESGLTDVLNNLTPGGILKSAGSGLGPMFCCICFIFTIIGAAGAYMKYKKMQQ